MCLCVHITLEYVCVHVCAHVYVGVHSCHGSNMEVQDHLAEGHSLLLLRGFWDQAQAVGLGTRYL